MYCDNCGSEIDDGARFCEYCGRAIAGPPPSAGRVVPVHSGDTSDAIEGSRKARTWIWVACGAGLVVGLFSVRFIVLLVGAASQDIIPSEATVASVSVGEDHACRVRTDDSLECRGDVLPAGVIDTRLQISGQQSLTFTENQPTDPVLATYSGTDPEDPSAPITRWSLTGADAGDFEINENGELSFRNVPDHEKPADSGRDNVYNFSVRASDGRNYGYLPVTVVVEDVNEPPEIGSGSRTEFSYRENGAAALYTYRATDPEQADIAWSLTGPDAGDFAISETGVLSFASPPDHENPADAGSDNVYNITVVASDDALNSSTLEVTVTVTDQNEGPAAPENAESDMSRRSFEASEPSIPTSSLPLADPDLYSAVWRGQAEQVRALVAGGANVNARNSDNDPLLHEAVWRNDVEVVQILVDAGADVNQRDSDNDPLLHEAIWRGHTEIVRILVNAGADVNARDSDGDTVLHEATWRGHTEIVQILIEAGAEG